MRDDSDHSSDARSDATRNAPPSASSPAARILWGETHARRAYVAASGAQQRAARRALLVGLVAFALIASVGALALAPGYFAAQGVVSAYCAALRGHDYPAAYALLATNARGGLSPSAYTRAMQALDTAEGPVSRCDTGGVVGYLPGQAGASDTLTLTRPRATLHGTLGLTDTRAGWRITTVAQALYGAPLGAVAVAADYCTALAAGDAATTYALLSATMQGTQTESDYLSAQRLRDTLTGRVTGCAVIGLTTPDAQTVNALLSVTRATGPRQGGELQLQPDGGGVWRINQLDPAIQGVDVGPYLVGQRFCAAIAAGDFGGAYSLLTGARRAQMSLSQMRATLTPPPGARWRCGQPLSGSYSVTGGVASYSVPLISTAPDGAPGQRTLSLQFALIGGQWQVSGY